MTKGFTQTLGVDFHDTFALVVRPQTVKIILTLALGKSWPMHQLDVNNAFLQGDLAKEVFMVQPLGFKHNQHPSYVCKLHKAIFDLHQAPRAWHDALKSFVTCCRFVVTKSDPSLFVYSKGATIAYFLAFFSYRQ